MLTQSLPGIIRHARAETPELEPGQVVFCFPRFLASRNHQEQGLVYPLHSIRCYTVPRVMILDCRQFLLNQPRKHFWALLAESTVENGPQYLANLTTEQLGAVPHRFDSLGEIYRYCHVREITVGQFMVVEFQSVLQVPKYMRRAHQPEPELAQSPIPFLV